MSEETSVEETTAPPAEVEATEPRTEPEAPDTEEVETESGDEGEDGNDTPAKKPDGFQKRINQLTRRLREAERKLAQREEPPKKEEPKGPPKLEDYGQDHQRYLADLVRHEAREAIQAEQQQQTSRQEQAKQQERLTKFMTADEAFQDSNADYRGAFELGQDPTFPITDSVLEAIVESEHGPALLHYLDSNREEAAAISQMSPARAAAAIGRLEAKLEAPPQVAPAKPVPKAPPPPPSVKPTARAKKSPEDMTMEEYIAWRGQK